MASSIKSQVRVAVTQAEPVWLDLDATVDKTCTLIAEAASNRAEIIAFPECWIPGYPAWIWLVSRPVDPALTSEYMRNSLTISSAQMTKIQECAAANKILVVLGFSENRHHSLYISQAIIDADGSMLTTRTKIKATHMERTIFGDARSGTECLDRNVVDTTIGSRVGTLSCWEHAQPLLKYHTYAQREQVHVAAWPPLFEHDGGDELWSMSQQGTQALSSTYAIESQSFVLHCTAVLSAPGIEKMRTSGGVIMSKPGGGSSAIFGPDGRKIPTTPAEIPETEEGILYADLDLCQVLNARAFLDVCGHYSRPDLLWLGVDAAEKKPVRSL
ncbi:aliphatic nitrilase [Xylariales sp. PMI_506]|nr:aliphatic nitrilase [Xylariales sp. PMI_506]